MSLLDNCFDLNSLLTLSEILQCLKCPVPSFFLAGARFAGIGVMYACNTPAPDNLSAKSSNEIKVERGYQDC